jgi:hypothetical protein
MDIKSQIAQLAPDQTSRMLQAVCERSPSTAAQVASAVTQAAKEGRIGRARSGFLYATIGFLFDALGAAPATLPPWFALPQGANDPSLGGARLGAWHTNQAVGGSMPGGRRFIADALGFGTFLLSGGSGGATNLALASIQYAVARSVAATLNLGDARSQDLGPIELWPSPQPGLQSVRGDLAAGAESLGEVSLTPSIGQAVMGSLEVPLDFKPNLQFSVVPTMGLTIPTAAAQADVCVAIRCALRGVWYDVVTG